MHFYFYYISMERNVLPQLVAHLIILFVSVET